MKDQNNDDNHEYELDERMLRKAEKSKYENEWKQLRKAALSRMSEAISQSYMAGMSVVEIKRSMGKVNVVSVLKTLSIRNILKDLPSPCRTKYKLPENIRYAMERIKFPFNQWCFVNNFDPKEATAALKKHPLDPMPDSWLSVHKAASIDFPRAYADEYDVDPPEYTPGYTREETRPSIHIEWEPDRKFYCGTIPGTPEVVIRDVSMDKVYEYLANYISIDRQATRMEDALARYELSIQGPIPM